MIENLKQVSRWLSPELKQEFSFWLNWELWPLNCNFLLSQRDEKKQTVVDLPTNLQNSSLCQNPLNINGMAKFFFLQFMLILIQFPSKNLSLPIGHPYSYKTRLLSTSFPILH